MAIYYKAGYKYQLTNAYCCQLGPEFLMKVREVETDFLWLGESGELIVKKGYAWDGPSGPTIDTKNFMRGSLVHDALYQLIRLGCLDKNIYRLLADETLYRICREDGMSWIRACVVYYAVRVFGNPSARIAGESKVIIAP
jgi:hypothetical protein